MRKVVSIDPKPRFKLSPYNYMQFMEPLSVTDSSVDAGWDYVNECWRPDLLETAKYLSPAMVRWGGCFASYYRWKEAVGPYDKRLPMLNLFWDGIYSNHVGTKEVIQFCRITGAEPLLVVNMESEGKMGWAYPVKGMCRMGDSKEAAEWVDYCNNPDNTLRRLHDSAVPYDVRYWQIGNETSYMKDGYDLEKAAETTRRFALEMRSADPSIKLIAWGDDGWAGRMCEIAGNEIDYVAFHHHFDSGMDNSPLYGTEYRKDPALTWEHLMNAYKSLETHIDEVREQVEPYGKRIAITEAHFSLPGRNRCEVLSSWAAGVAYARCLNVQERNGDILDIATMADFFGNRWQVNAIILPTPERLGKPYLQPVGWVMSLFRRHTGRQEAAVTAPPELDVTASRTDGKLYLHVANTCYDKSIKVVLEVEDMCIKNAIAYEISADPQLEITQLIPDAFEPKAINIAGNEWEFPAASVTVIELDIEDRYLSATNGQ